MEITLVLPACFMLLASVLFSVMIVWGALYLFRKFTEAMKK